MERLWYFQKTLHYDRTKLLQLLHRKLNHHHHNRESGKRRCAEWPWPCCTALSNCDWMDVPECINGLSHVSRALPRCRLQDGEQRLRAWAHDELVSVVQVWPCVQTVQNVVCRWCHWPETDRLPQSPWCCVSCPATWCPEFDVGIACDDDDKWLQKISVVYFSLPSNISLSASGISKTRAKSECLLAWFSGKKSSVNVLKTNKKLEPIESLNLKWSRASF